MHRDEIINQIEQEQLNTKVAEFHVGDTIRVSTKIIEGEKERIQVFQGTVIARKGKGLSETFSLHRVSYGEGMERVFYLHSPRITQVEIVKKGDVRRAKLYYLRGKTGKAAKIHEKIGGKKAKRDEQDPFESRTKEISIEVEDVAIELEAKVNGEAGEQRATEASEAK
ncbi:MAG: 50S ribosomal protein L19 [Chlamydiia bacterium]|nr:50S ribosomal protein L19 [Chlamydiia bacterium]